MTDLYKAGAFTSRPAREKAIREVSIVENLDLKHQIDAMYKDIEKKEIRNVNLLKEIQTLRTNFATSQVFANN